MHYNSRSSNALCRLPASRLLADGTIHFVTWRIADRQPSLAPIERDVVAAALRFHAGQRYLLHAWVVMDDHVHVVATPHAGIAMQAILASWRTFTARALCLGGHRIPPLWQRGFYDRSVRTDAELAEKVLYVQKNPWKRWPALANYTWVSREEK